MTEHQEVLCCGGPLDGQFYTLPREHDHFRAPATPRREARRADLLYPPDPIEWVGYQVIECQRTEDTDENGPLKIMDPWTHSMVPYEVTGYWKIAVLIGQRPTPAQLRHSFMRCKCHRIVKKYRDSGLIFASYDY